MIPQKNTVIAITSESKDMGASMDLVWEHILPALKDEEEIEKNATDHKTLLSTIDALSLATLDHPSTSSINNNKINKKTYALAKNKIGAKKIALNLNENSCIATVDFGITSQTFTAGFGKWLLGQNSFQIDGSPLTAKDSLNTKSAGCAGWKDDNTLLLDFKMVEGIHSELWTLNFEEEKIKISFKSSNKILGNPDSDQPPWEGKLV